MTGWEHLTLGLALPLAAWCALRLTVEAGLRPTTAVVADGALPLFAYLLVFAAAGKPVFAGAIIAATIAAFAIADREKRRVLREPVVFTDAHQTIDILVRHPELNALFSKSGFVVWTALAFVAILAGIFIWEPSIWSWSVWPGLAAAAVAAIAGWSIRGPLLDRLATLFLRCGVTADPAHDARIVGPFAMHLAYAIIALAERPWRRDAVRPMATAAKGRRRSGALAPVVVVQCESFFDPRRLHPAMLKGLLPAFDECRANGVQYGRLSVPGFGANSVRTEFAVLSGLPETAIGFDRFNPYFSFVRSPIRSIAWRMRAEGYRTICVHPFDRRFYRRDQALYNLGFDVFVGDEAFLDAARAGPYVADVEVARRVAEILWDEGPEVFVFAITMENHGPWGGGGVPDAPDIPPGLPEFSGRETLAGFLRGVRGADAMLGMLADTMRMQGESALLAFYGDHLPCLEATFRQFGFDDRRTDYLIWSPGVSEPLALDLSAPALSRAIWDAWQFRAPRASADFLRLDNLVLPAPQ